MDEIVADLTPAIEALAVDWPPGFGWRWRGEVETAAETCADTEVALAVALVLVFGVVGAVAFLGESLSLTQALGSFPVLVTVLAIVRRAARPPGGCVLDGAPGARRATLGLPPGASVRHGVDERPPVART